MQQLTQANALSARLEEMTRQGWRVDTCSDTRAAVSRPDLWMPGWAIVVLVLLTGPIGMGVLAAQRSPRARRTRRLLTVWPDGTVRETRGAV